jgi:hypothetical protein
LGTFAVEPVASPIFADAENPDEQQKREIRKPVILSFPTERVVLKTEIDQVFAKMTSETVSQMRKSF